MNIILAILLNIYYNYVKSTAKEYYYMLTQYTIKGDLVEAVAGVKNIELKLKRIGGEVHLVADTGSVFDAVILRITRAGIHRITGLEGANMTLDFLGRAALDEYMRD